MGTSDRSTFGGFRGKVGGLVSYTLKGKNVVRTVGYSSKPASKGRLAQYQRMGVINGFLKPILPFINSSLELAVAGTDRNQYNEAISLNKEHAIQGEYPDLQMDYAKAIVSKGTLAPALNASISLIGNFVEFRWDLQTDLQWDSRLDRTMLLVFFPEKNKAVMCFTGARRIEQRDVLEIPPEYTALRMEAYLAFIADDRLALSDSVWIGLT